MASIFHKKVYRHIVTQKQTQIRLQHLHRTSILPRGHVSSFCSVPLEQQSCRGWLRSSPDKCAVCQSIWSPAYSSWWGPSLGNSGCTCTWGRRLAAANPLQRFFQRRASRSSSTCLRRQWSSRWLSCHGSLCSCLHRWCKDEVNSLVNSRWKIVEYLKYLKCQTPKG